MSVIAIVYKKDDRAMSHWHNQACGCIHRPLSFSNVHNQKTRDRISVQDWNLLIASRNQYDCAAPQFRRTTIQIATSEQTITLRSEHSVTKRIESFMFHLHFEDETLQTYGLS